MPIFKKTLMFTMPVALVASVALGSIAGNDMLLPLINQTFLTGLLLLIVGTSLLVIRSGFFTVFAMGFTRLKRMFFRQARALEGDLYQREKSNPYYRTTYFLLGIGISVLLFSIALTVFYYLL